MLTWCRLIIWFHDHLPFVIIYCSTVSVTWRMLKLCENGSNIDYLYETSSVLRKATGTKISGLTFWLFSSVRVFKNRTEIRFPHITSSKADEQNQMLTEKSHQLQIISKDTFLQTFPSVAVWMNDCRLEKLLHRVTVTERVSMRIFIHHYW